MVVDNSEPLPPPVPPPPQSASSQTNKNTRRRRSIEVKDPDNFLEFLGDILERLHGRFYKQFDEMAKGLDIDEMSDIPTPDLKKLIPEMRHSVLKGTRILFTGVIPTNMPPHKNREWNTARAFGAIIHDRLVPGLHSSDPNKAFRATTHVIAGRPGTSKLREAKRFPGVKVVNPRWLWSCAEQWKLVDEKLFPLQFEKEKSEEKQQHPERETKSESRTTYYEPPPKKVMKIVSRNSEEDKQPAPTPESISTEATPTEQQSIPPPTEVSQFESTVPTLIEKTTELDSDSDSDDNDETFLTSDRLTEDVEKDSAMLQRLREFKRHMSLESRLSVSDEELEKMDAEVEAEISSSDSSNNGDEDLGTFIEEKDDDNLLSYENYAGSEASSEDKNELASERLSRKRKHADIENNSSSSHSPSLDHLNDSIEPSDDEEGGGEEGGEGVGILATPRNLATMPMACRQCPVFCCQKLAVSEVNSNYGDCYSGLYSSCNV